jgi:mannose-1-phosphate guanylyltransferase
MSLHPVIMAGGSGTRFWPLSRKSRPKQFLPLASATPLITDTASRLKGLASAKDVWVVCGKVHAPQVSKLVKGIRKSHVLVEPVARNTAPAIALAAAHVFAADPEGILIVLPSDHHIANPKAFRDTLAAAAELAEDGSIVTVGIKPRSPETGYGYIRVGDKLSGQARKVAAFVEKPNLETAKSYLASGDYLWNGGIFVFRADVMLKAIDQHMPEMRAGLAAITKAIGTRRYEAALKKHFPSLPSQSIDYGVMEKASNIAVIPGDFGWSDVGSFAAVPEVREQDAAGNVVSGKNALAIDCEDSIVLAKDRLIAVVGMKDVVVVDAGDALLVVPKSKAQDVRKAVDALKSRKLEKYL